MSEYSSLKATINANVKTNDNHEITGSIMNSVLNAMVNSLGAGYQFIGVATPTNPGSAQTPDYKCFYLATTPGTYTYLGGLVVADGEVALLKYDTSWTKEVTGIATAESVSQLGQDVKEKYGKGLILSDMTMTSPEKDTANRIKVLKFVPPVALKGHTFTLWRMCGSSENKIGIYDVTADISLQYVTGLKTDIFAGYYNCETSAYSESIIYVEADARNYTGLFFSNKILAKIQVIETTAEDAVFSLITSLAGKASTTDLSNEITNRQNAVSAESASRESADNALLGRINNAVVDVHIIGEQLYNKTNGSNGIAFGSNRELFAGTKYLSVQIEVNCDAGDVFSFKNFSSQIQGLNDILIGYGDTITIGETITGRTTASVSEMSNQQGKITIPVASKYLLIAYSLTNAPSDAMRTDFEDKMVVIKGTSYPSEYIAYTETIEHIIKNYWTGKRIWWCGTSIPKGKDDKLGADETVAGNYPTQVGHLLGANVFNEAEGSSMCRANVRTGDYNGANINNITSALTMTNAEAEAFIANYDTLRQLSGNTDWPITLSDSYKESLRAASFENRLLPYLDGTLPMPDLFVIDHGHNDWKYTLSGGQTDITLEPIVANIGGELAEDTYMTDNDNENLESFFGSLDNIPSAKKAEFIASVNRNCFIGAVNFIITLILRYNPHARIMFVSNYEKDNGEWRQMSAVITAQNYLATSWAFPICEVYKYLGFSNHIIPSSKAWFNTTYSPRESSTDINVFRAYNPDLVHPHSDTTGTAIDVYAGVLAEFIKTCR